MKGNFLIGKTCKLEFISDFVLTGRVLDADEHGIIFETDQKTSFIHWSKIEEIVPVE
jgi:hypothetical protein